MSPVETDGSGKRYVDVPTLSDEHVRAAFVLGDQAGYGAHYLHIQIRDAAGHLRQGPEIPVSILGEVSGAVIALLAEQIGT